MLNKLKVFEYFVRQFVEIWKLLASKVEGIDIARE